MEALKNLLDLILPEGTQLEKRRIATGAWRLALSLFMLYCLGWFSVFGFDGFANAEDVDVKIKKAIVPIKSDLNEIKAQQSESKALLQAILITQITDRLRELDRIKCKTPDSQRAIEIEIEDSQQKYRALTGERYPLPSCDEH